MIKEWFTEPATHDFFAEGYWCEIKRHPSLGHLNGYIYLPDTHPDFGKSYDDVDVSVHGGLTYADGGCFGFDCGHAGDLTPALEKMWAMNELPSTGIQDTYRNMAFVEKHLRSLARQFKDREDK
jgi:hypothetical protein